MMRRAAIYRPGRAEARPVSDVGLHENGLHAAFNIHQHSLDPIADFRRQYLDARENDALTILDLRERQNFNGS